HSLTRWLRETAEVAATANFSQYLLMIGISHSHRPAHNPGGVIPVHLMIGAMSLAQSALAGMFDGQSPHDAAVRASVAWNKLLLLHLSVLLLGYLPAKPIL